MPSLSKTLTVRTSCSRPARKWLCALLWAPCILLAGRLNATEYDALPLAANTPDLDSSLFDTPTNSTAPSTPAVSPPAPSQNVTINLINRLVQRGVLTKEDAADLLQMAEADAATARSREEETRTAAVEAARQAAAEVAPEPLPDDTIRVPYVPEYVKAQMREEIRQDVMQTAREENWANPETLPEWVPRFRVAGDIRLRFEGLFYPEGNDNTGAFPNFNAINTGSPFDVSGTVFSPQYNVDQDRRRFRLRARLGAEVEMGDGFTAGLRIATGDSSAPTSTNQTLGNPGDFSKYGIWLDRAFLSYEVGGLPQKDFSIAVGRFENPFFSTNLTWDDDVGFDGVAIQARYQVVKGVTPFLVAGAFPVFNTSLNFASNNPAKFKSQDKYLYAGQLGVDWQIREDLRAKFAGAYYYFDNIEGRLSSPFTPVNSSDAGNTDETRPPFAQRGNTYMALRNIVPNANNNFGTINQWQYFGLATPFQELAFTGRIDYSRFEPVQISLLGEFVVNLAYDHQDINAIAVNNRGPTNGVGIGTFEGGDTAWMVELKVGTAALQKRWDWNLSVGYRYVESDAVVDAFTDSDFGGGGTNLQGFTIGGALALSPRVWVALRWLSAESIAGPTYKNDILQFDLNGKF